ncbi:hypothetical protein F5X97DRAFT_285276 [Nemania serpens]|nr:hypothetical protein F5X97DRAFT_285276 [Nemania serpens]
MLTPAGTGWLVLVILSRISTPIWGSKDYLQLSGERLDSDRIRTITVKSQGRSRLTCRVLMSIIPSVLTSTS